MIVDWKIDIGVVGRPKNKVSFEDFIENFTPSGVNLVIAPLYIYIPRAAIASHRRRSLLSSTSSHVFVPAEPSHLHNAVGTSSAQAATWACAFTRKWNDVETVKTRMIKSTWKETAEKDWEVLSHFLTYCIFSLIWKNQYRDAFCYKGSRAHARNDKGLDIYL